MKKSIKDAAKKGQTDVAKILAKELVQSRKAVSKLYTSKAQMNSVLMSMQQQNCKNLDMRRCSKLFGLICLHWYTLLTHLLLQYCFD